MMILDFNRKPILCAHCKKQKGQHKAKTLECPRAMRTRIGYTEFGPTRYTPKVKTNERR